MTNETPVEESDILRRNIHAIADLQDKSGQMRSHQERTADRITGYSGSMGFVYLHIIWFSVWIILNIGLINLRPLTEFDPFPFGLLTMIVSLEAIFLSTFVLITQNRQAKTSERRSELDLQINLLAEQKTAKILELLDHLIEQFNAMNNSFYVSRDDEASALKVSPTPEEVMKGIKESEVEGEVKKRENATASNISRKESEQEKIK
jgi:uncharacterized membrane protein